MSENFLTNHLDLPFKVKFHIECPVEGLIQLPDTAIYQTVQIFQLVPLTYQSEYHCLSVTILKYDYFSLAAMWQICALSFCLIFVLQITQVWAKNELNPCLGLNMPHHNFSHPIPSLKSSNILSYSTHDVCHPPLHIEIPFTEQQYLPLLGHLIMRYEIGPCQIVLNKLFIV